MGRELGEMLGLQHELRQGLQRGEFVVHYQPAIDIDTRAVVGVEALVRWQSPTRGLVPPDRFIPVAEASGLIHSLGEFVLQTACMQATQWGADGLLPGKLRHVGQRVGQATVRRAFLGDRAARPSTRPNWHRHPSVSK